MKQENAAFISFPSSDIGMIFDDYEHKEYPIRYFNVCESNYYTPEDGRSYYGFVYEGGFVLVDKEGRGHNLYEGMYFSISGKHQLVSRIQSKAVVIEVFHQEGRYRDNNFMGAMTHVGGPIEKEGRLKYIDGCTDSLLIPPVKLGDPCLNHLHFPPNITQTPHTHPSHRIGIVTRGNGLCVTPFGNLPLRPGNIFVIKEWDGKSWGKGLDGQDYEVGNHCFYTFEESMDVIAFHPDSDFGPQDEFHPMINRTIVKGISANKIQEIRTK